MNGMGKKINALGSNKIPSHKSKSAGEYPN